MDKENNITVLVVEDEKDTIDLLSSLLQRQGYQVRTACTGSEGLIAAQDPVVALTLLDIMLPDTSGFDTCLKIKENRPQLPVIILSVRSRQIDIVTGLDCGADDYVTKPFSTPELLARVRVALRTSLTNTADVRPRTVEEAGTCISNALFAVAQPLSRLLQPAAIAETIVEQTETVLDVEHRAVCIWREELKNMVREHISVSDPIIESALQNLDPGWEQALYEELRDRQESIFASETCLPHSVIRTLHAELGSHITLVAPIKSQDDLLGTLLLFRKSQSAFSADEFDIIAGVTCQAGIALNHARFLSKLERDRGAGFEQPQQVSELLPIISHELRTPIAAIKGFITTLLSNHRYWDEREREAFLENVNVSVDQLSQLVENALEMGRLDRGLQFHKRPIQLASLVQRLLHNLSFHSNRCVLANEIPAHLPVVAADPVKIERVLHNLLVNSIKFSPLGGRIRVFAQAMEKEIEVGVEDQGIGISPQHLPHIFEQFYQAGQTEAHRQGIGLGLYIAQELIRVHGGQVRAESQLGRGTTIYFTLPLNGSTSIPERTLSDASYRLPAPSPSKQSYRPGGQSTILIVEDDSQMLSSLEENLQAAGFKVLATSQGDQAIELVRSEKLDLILLDLSLPDVDGLAVCERVRWFSNIPIIIITGRKAETYKVQGLALGADDYLVKPFSNRELLARVQAVLRRAQIPYQAEPLTRLKFNGFEIDPLRYEVKTAQGAIKLTPTEHKLLYYLASNADHILTHQQLLTWVWGYECDYQPAYLWVNISRLRKKIEPDPTQPRYIITEPGIGYRFRAGRVSPNRRLASLER